MTENIIYKVKTADFGNVFSHLVKCNEEFVPRLTDKVDINTYSKKIVENSITFEAWVNDELAGLIAAYFNNTKDRIGYITNVSTLKIYGGKGIGSQLMEMCFTYAAEHQFIEIALEVFNKNTAAIQLYKKFEFHQSAIKDDLIIMKKYL